jgi:plastocyanin
MIYARFKMLNTETIASRGSAVLLRVVYSPRKLGLMFLTEGRTFKEYKFMLLKYIKLVSIASAIILVPAIAQAEEITVTQTDKSFKLNGTKVENLTIKAGDSIKFLNEDPWFHNIFSLSDLKTFDLGSYPKGQFKTVVFEKAGKADIECAIHPNMMLHLEVK